MRSAHECHVERAGLESGERVDGVFAMQDQAQIRKMLGDQRPQRRQYSDVGGWKRPYGELAGAPVRRLLREPPRMLDAAENILRLAQKYSSCVRQGDVVATAIEQLGTDGALEAAGSAGSARAARYEPVPPRA